MTDKVSDANQVTAAVVDALHRGSDGAERLRLADRPRVFT